ncbi:MAG: hypothetical protein SA339_11725 [Methanomassiliicoccus sp.]|nr:hypothetical protein [Methanomassiliicoccus sp.]
MANLAIIELVASQRCRQMRKEKPIAEVEYTLKENEAIITVKEFNDFIGYEIVESLESLASPEDSVIRASDVISRGFHLGMVVPIEFRVPMRKCIEDIQEMSGCRPEIHTYTSLGEITDF